MGNTYVNTAVWELVDVSNYRDISRGMNVRGNIFTTLLSNQLVRLAEEFNILPDCQGSYRKGHVI